jgi:hypothetical protein
MNKLQARKQLLIAESELNRAELVQEWEALADGYRSVTHCAKSFTSVVSSTATLLGGLAALRRRLRDQTDGKSSWLNTILKTASLLSDFWLAFRSPGRSRDETKSG